MGEKAVFAVEAHIFQIDQQTKKRWLPSSIAAVRVAYYHDPGRKTFRIIAIENSKALINSTITANMNFTKTSPKFGQWSDHRANTVYGLGFSSEDDIIQFMDKFSEAKEAARKAVEERKLQGGAAGAAGGKKSGDVDTSSSPAESPPHQATPISPPAVQEEEKKVMVNGQANKNASSAEASPAVSRAGGSVEAQLEALRYDNSKLKSALASSTQNVKKWEGEMQTLKNNNVKLTVALKESNQHVAEWKEKLQQYKEESAHLQRKVAELEAERSEAVSREEFESVKRENEELKEVLTAVQLDLEARQSDITQRNSQLRDTNTQLVDVKARIAALEEENGGLQVRESELEDQLHMAGVASRRKMEQAGEGHAKLGQMLQEAIRLHQTLTANFKL